jgi:hypothetical protein
LRQSPQVSAKARGTAGEDVKSAAKPKPPIRPEVRSVDDSSCS